MIGVVAYSQLLNASTRGAFQITITPFEFSWQRIIANIAWGGNLGNMVYVPTFQGGISFGTVLAGKVPLSHFLPILL
jgi:hypothetical protein